MIRFARRFFPPIYDSGSTISLGNQQALHVCRTSTQAHAKRDTSLTLAGKYKRQANLRGTRMCETSLQRSRSERWGRSLYDSK
jgi:hypothetical protein